MNEGESRKSSFIREILGCMTSPRSSFRSVLDKPSLMKAISLVLAIAIIAAWASFNYMGKFPLTHLAQQLERLFPGQRTPVSPEQLRQAWMIMSALMALIGVFGTWIISSALIHGFSTGLRGNGSFRSMLTLTGYASTPLLIQQLLRLAHSFAVSQEEMLQLATSPQVSAHPLLNSIASAALNIFTIFRLWSIVLLIIAASENYKISMTRSTVAIFLSLIVIIFVSAFLPLR